MAKVSCTLGQRHRLSHRGDLGPRLVPLHLCRDVPHGELVVGELLEQVIESLLVMLDQLAGAATDVVDRNAVCTETAGDVHVLHPCERVEEIGEGVTLVEWVHEIADVWCRLLQDVVTGEHDVGVVEVEADVTRRVAGGVDNAEAAAGQRDDLVVREKAVGSGTRGPTGDSPSAVNLNASRSALGAPARSMFSSW